MIVDGWVRDPRIRRDALVGFAMLLFTAAVVAEIGFSGGANALGRVLATTVGKISIGAGAVGAAGTVAVFRHRKRGQMQSAEHTPEHHGSGGCGPLVDTDDAAI